MQIKISFNDLPEAKDREDGEIYEVSLRQISHDKDGATFEIAKAEEENYEEDGEESFSNM